MGQQIIQQPDGKYCVFSDNVDDFVLTDCTPEDIIEVWAGEERARIVTKVRRIISELEGGGRPYYQFTMTYQEAVRWRDTVHTKEKQE